MTQTILALSILVVSVAYVARRSLASIAPKKKSCGCGGCGCSKKKGKTEEPVPFVSAPLKAQASLKKP